MKFSEWWLINKALYEKAGVEESIAYAIWCASADNFYQATMKQVQKLN